jgi:hypothetical protein
LGVSLKVKGGTPEDDGYGLLPQTVLMPIRRQVIFKGKGTLKNGYLA